MRVCHVPPRRQSATSRNRTRDRPFTKRELYQLSYCSKSILRGLYCVYRFVQSNCDAGTKTKRVHFVYTLSLPLSATDVWYNPAVFPKYFMVGGLPARQNSHSTFSTFIITPRQGIEPCSTEVNSFSHSPEMLPRLFTFAAFLILRIRFYTVFTSRLTLTAITPVINPFFIYVSTVR